MTYQQTRLRVYSLFLALVLALPLAGGCERGDDRADELKRLTPAQRQAILTLRDQRRRREISRTDYLALRRQIRPASVLALQEAGVAQARAATNAGIVSNGYDGREDCLPPPDGMRIPEVIARTPIDPVDLGRLRAAAPGQDADATAAVDAFLAARGTDAPTSGEVVGRDVDPWGRYHARLRQTHGGVPLTKGGFGVHRRADGSLAVSDFMIEGIDVDTTPSVESGPAGALALAAIDPTGASGYQATPVLRIDPVLENVIVDRSDPENGASYEWRLRDAQLVWQVLVAPDYSDFNTGFDAILAASPVTFDGPGDPADRDANTLLGGREDDPLSDETPWVYPTATPYLVTVSATTGEVMEIESLLTEDLDDFAAPPTVGLGLGYFNSLVDLNTTYWQPFDAYVLADFTRSKPGTANLVLHGNNLDSHDTADFDLFLDANNIWGNGLVNFSDPACLTCTTGQTPAVDIAFGVQRTYDFLANVLGRAGTDDAGASQTAIAHWDQDYSDAHHNGASGLIAFGNGKDASGPGNYSLGTVAHEIGHAIWKKEEVGTSGNPAKAMNEGHGDVLGGLTDIYQDNTDGQGDWLYRIPWAGGKWRGRTRDPSGYEECVTSNEIEMCETGRRYWDFFVEISTFEHVGGIPFTRAIMHLAEGSSTDLASPYYTKFFPTVPMRGVGLNKAAAIWIHTVSHFLPASPNLAEARFAAFQAAEDLFGAGSDEARATANAFAAVGMGAKPVDTTAPDITVANVHSINPRTLTAKTYAVSKDDTGSEMVEPPGMARKNDAFLGYLDLSDFQVGYDSVTFRSVDSEGHEDTTTRVCWLPYRPQLLDDGGFEESFGSEWNGANVGDDEGGAFFGERYLKVGASRTWQTLDLTDVKGPELSYWVAANKGVGLFDQMSVRVLDTDLNPLGLLALHDLGDDWFPRPARSNGYLNFRQDLSAWEGQEVVIAFEATGNGLFRVDHVVASFASVALLPPEILVFETDNSVFLNVTDEAFAPFEAMDLSPRVRVDGIDAGDLESGGNGVRTAHLAIDALAPGAHSARTVAVNDADAFIAAGNHDWFAPKPVNELLANGRFESQLDGWETAGLGVSLENANGGEVFQGDFGVRLGGQGVVNEATISQEVSVPNHIKSLKFTVRARREFSGSDEDVLVVDFLDTDDQVLDSAVLRDTANFIAAHDPPHVFQTFRLLSHAPPTAPLSGKTIRVRLRTVEGDGMPTTFVIDNASLSYTNWGLQLGS